MSDGDGREVSEGVRRWQKRGERGCQTVAEER